MQVTETTNIQALQDAVGRSVADLVRATVRYALAPPVVVDPPPIDAPPVVDPPAAPAITGQTLTADFTDIRVGDAFVLNATLVYSDGSTKPVTAYNLHGYSKAVIVPIDGKSYTRTFTALAEGITSIKNDNSGTTGTLSVTVLAADPARPPRQPPTPTSGGAPVPPVTAFNLGSPPASPQGAGNNTVKVTVDPHDGHVLTAIAKVGDDAKAAPVYCAFVNDVGEASDMLTIHAYADGCHVGVVRLDTATDMADCSMSVEYNGVEIFNQDFVNFPRGQWNNFIRYGTAPAWKSVERNPCLPNFAWGESQTISSDKAADYSYNGAGIDPQASTATTGERGAIGYVPQWDMSFVLQPSDETWALTRKVADTCFGRQTVRCHPTTGGIISIDDYPGITTFSAQQNGVPGKNPVPNYQGVWARGVFSVNTDGRITGGNARGSDTAHLTHFSLVAALATESAHDLDALAFQANSPLLHMNPSYRSTRLLAQQQQRSLAWGLAYLFPASQVGRFVGYFKQQMDKQLAILEAREANPLHVIAVTTPYVVAAMPGWKGAAAWQEDYTQLALDPIGNVLPEWRDVCADHATFRALQFARNGKLRPACIASLIYDFLHIDPSGTWVDVDAATVASLQGAGWPLEDAQAIVATDDVPTAVALYAKHSASVIKVSESGMPDMPGSSLSTDGYCSQMKMALASAVNYKVPGWEVCKQWLDKHPTNPDYGTNQKYHVVPQVA